MNRHPRRNSESNEPDYGSRRPQGARKTNPRVHYHRYGQNPGSSAHPPTETSTIAKWWSRLSGIPKLLAVLAAIGGITSAGILIFNSCIAEKGPAQFKGDLESAKGSSALISMLKREDGEVVYLDARCLYWKSKKPACGWLTEMEKDFGGTMVALTEDSDCAVEQEQETAKQSYDSQCPDAYWLHVLVDPNTGARADNGSYGAGAVSIKGYFSVTVTGADPGLPQEITNIELRSVSPEDVDKGA
ncbi:MULTISPECIES: hypothetical protein [Streptomyces]|uniref:Uncharacterized protein n=1 Tax=Streptomyces griseosporeus TaxID=1910 RepID=A0ABV3KLK8_STRGS|nr:hypothetical protein [Streptomyces actuosus]MBM4821995.1 hypothetical protein [Streptomyces actuosus]